jgi:FtsH-binding integral membrane protein
MNSSGVDSSSFNLKTMFSFSDIAEKTKTHLTKVYGTIMLSCLFSAIGAFLNHSFMINGFLLHIASIILSIFLVCQIQNRNKSESERVAYLVALAFQLGFLIGPVINMLLEFEPELLIQAVFLTATAFSSFSLISLCSKRRSFLFLGGLIMTLIQGMAMYRLFSWLFGYNSLNMGFLMIGLFTCCLFIIYDTQMIIERAERGDKDVPSHALLLFIDLFNMFIKILQILMKLKEGESEDGKKKK